MIFPSSPNRFAIFSPQGASTSVPKLMAAYGGFFSITRLLASLFNREYVKFMTEEAPNTEG